MKKIDAKYRIENSTMLFFPKSPKCAAWLAKYRTTNIAETIFFEKNYGQELVQQLKEDGLNVVLDKSRA